MGWREFDRPGGNQAKGLAINNLGVVVGDGNSGPSLNIRALVSSNGSLQDLPLLPGAMNCSSTDSIAGAINDLGEIVGVACGPGGQSHAVLWSSSSSTPTDLGTLGGSYSAAYDINTNGQIVGYVTASSGGFRAFLYENASMTDMNNLIASGSGWELSWALAINNKGMILGSGVLNGQSEPFLYQDGAVAGLNDLISPNSGWVILPPLVAIPPVIGWDVSVPWTGRLWPTCDINDAGYIATQGLTNGQKRAVLLVPTGIEAVVWEEINSTLDANPTNVPGGGLRIFPDKISPTDTNAPGDRARVTVRATITPPMDGVTVYFQSFDVDDPSTNAPPIDGNDDGGPHGLDNHGLLPEGFFTPDMPVPLMPVLSTASAVTDASGEATVEFNVTMQPGDNFRVAAALRTNHLAGLTNDNVPAGTNQIAGFAGKLSDMLTVWRRLWIELDSMGPPASGVGGQEANWEGGSVRALQTNVPAIGQSTLDLHFFLNSASYDGAVDRFEYGFIDIDGVGIYTNISNTALSSALLGSVDCNLVITGAPPLSATNTWFKLYDDDWVTKPSGTNFPARIMPYTVSGGSLITNAFAEAYILPVYAPAEYIDTNVAFKANLSATGSLFLDYWTEWRPTVSATRDLEGAPDFWTAHLLCAWQAETDEDGDPDSELVQNIGQSDIPIIGNNQGAIYIETVREGEGLPQTPRVQEEHVVVHEIGHQGGGDHEDGWIMEEGAPTLYLGQPNDRFAPDTIDRFRRNAFYSVSSQ